MVAGGTELRRALAAKDESDLELALLAAVGAGADELVVLGAFGGPRLDHALANVGLLVLPALADRRVILLDAGNRLSAIVAPGPDGGPVRRSLPGRLGAYVSLLPWGGDALGITTEGLAWRLTDEPLRAGPARGLSNVRTDSGAAVTLRAGTLLVVEAASGGAIGAAAGPAPTGPA